MDLIASSKEKLPYFQVKELKEVLTQLGLSKQGKKQDLVQRISTILSDESENRLRLAKDKVAKLIEDVYRNFLAASRGKLDGPSQPDIKVRCICGISQKTESMIKCEDPRCLVWEHVGCVIIRNNSREVNLPLPKPFYCEICRLTRTDPFWVTMGHPLYPVGFTSTMVTGHSVDKKFEITRADKDLVVQHGYDIQAWCMLLNDEVLFRMHWPQSAILQVNGTHVRAMNRPLSVLLGANGRDDGPIITNCVRSGMNEISLSVCDSRRFCLGVRLVKRRSMQEVLNMIPGEDKGEPLEAALARIRRGTTGYGDCESDSDIEVIEDFFSVDLKCPMSGSRMKVAGRFKLCSHMGCFDLEVFVELNERSRKWQCPVCLKNYSLEHIIIDPYFNRITSKMRNCDEKLTEIEMKSDGSWRVKFKSESERKELGELSQWHVPEGSLVPTVDENKPKMETLTLVKQPASGSNKEVMVLSDSDEENDVVVPTKDHAFNENLTDGAGSSGLGLFTNSDDDSYMRQGSEADGNDGLVNKPLEFSREDRPLQIFLPMKPNTSAQSDLRNKAEMSNKTPGDEWLSLRLGDQKETTGVNRVNGNNSVSIRESVLDALSEARMGPNDNRGKEKASRERSEGSFSFPRKKR